MSILIVDSPLGPLRLTASADALISIDWEWVQQREAVSVNHPVLQQAASQLRGYFSGQLTQFSVPLALRGTAFQQRVWRALSPPTVRDRYHLWGFSKDYWPSKGGARHWRRRWLKSDTHYHSLPQGAACRCWTRRLHRWSDTKKNLAVPRRHPLELRRLSVDIGHHFVLQPLYRIFQMQLFSL